MRSLTRPLLGTAIAAFAVLSGATVASAHIDPDPVDAPAGSEQNVGFTVEHGCDGSPTIELNMRLPEGVTNPVPEPPEGWTGNVTANIVTFIGGPLPDAVEATFRVRMTLPDAPGSTIYFPFVQRCDQGEIAWIDVPSDGSGTELDEPAPAMNLTDALPVASTVPATTTEVASSVPVTTTAAASTTIAPSTTGGAATSTTAAQTTTTTEPTPATTVSSPDGTVTDGSGTWVFVGTAVAVAAVGGLAYMQMRKRRS